MNQKFVAALRSRAVPIRRGFLYAFVGSVAASAFLAIAAILFLDLGGLYRIAFSTGTIAVGSVCGLACAARLEAAQNQALPLLGIVVATTAAAAMLLLIWTEASDWEVWLQTTLSLGVFAVAVAHVCLLSMAKLAARFEWSRVVAYVVILFVAALLTSMIWFDTSGVDILRILAVAVILDAAVTILIPIFHRLSNAP